LTDISLKGGTKHTSLHHEFSDLLDDFGLTQHITEPTRTHYSKDKETTKNILDLIATNMPEQVNRVKVIPGISDHAIAYL
jgi:hypothetical protein